MNRIGLLLAGLVLGCSGSGPLVTQWEYTGGPYAQNVSAILPAGGQSLYAGLRNGELYHSANAGATWRKLGTVRDGAEIYGLLVDPDADSTLYAATSRGAYVSDDGGAAWNEIPFAGSAAGLGCRVLAIDPWSPSNMYIGSIGRGMFRSTDRGQTWIPVIAGEDPSLSLGDVSDIAINIQRPDEVYAAFATSGLMRSTDRGVSWTRITPEYSTAGAAITHVLLLPDAGGMEILYGTASGNIFQSVDGGSSWSPTRQGLESDRVLGLAHGVENPAVVYAGTGGGILRSTNFGTSWQSLASGGIP